MIEVTFFGIYIISRFYLLTKQQPFHFLISGSCVKILLKISVRTKLLQKRVQTSLVLYFSSSTFEGSNFEESGCIFLQAYPCADLLFLRCLFFTMVKKVRGTMEM